jgi:NAD(P) transhydrogenase
MTAQGADELDLLVIGGGPAGEKGAAQAAYFGKRVAVVERAKEPGGAAVHTGTLPSKTLREAALYLSGHRSRSLYGVAIDLEPQRMLHGLMGRKAAIAAAESLRIRNNLARHQVELIEGHARFTGPHEVCVTHADGSTRTLRAKFVLVATGTKPRQPDDIDFASPLVHDSDEVLEIGELPRSLTILGAGVIGCEYACMFAALGIPVELVEARDEILGFMDREMVAALERAMAELGVRLHLGRAWGAVTLGADGDSVHTQLGEDTLVTHHLLFAAGRMGCTADLGLEHVGVRPNSRGLLTVDEVYRTAAPYVLAAGDVIGFPALASTSMEQARVAVCHAFGFDYKKSVSGTLPYGIYTIPELSSVGESEESARAAGLDVVVGRAFYRENARGQITGDTEGITKLVVDRYTRKIVGVHVIGERASELVHIGQTALMAGATVDLFIEMVFNFPTLAESYKYAAYACLAQLGK